MSDSDSFVATFGGRIVGSAVALTVGTLVGVVAVRDFLLYLDSYDLGMVGTTGGVEQVVLLLLVGWCCLLLGVVYPARTVADARG